MQYAKEMRLTMVRLHPGPQGNLQVGNCLKYNKVSNINTGLHFAGQIDHTTATQPTSTQYSGRRDSWSRAVE